MKKLLLLLIVPFFLAGCFVGQTGPDPIEGSIYMNFQFSGVEAENVRLYELYEKHTWDNPDAYERTLTNMSCEYETGYRYGSESFGSFYFTIEDAEGGIKYFSGWDAGFEYPPEELKNITFEQQGLGILTCVEKDDTYSTTYTSNLLEAGFLEETYINCADLYYTITVDGSNVAIDLRVVKEFVVD